MIDWGLISASGAYGFADVKIWIIAATGLSRDALHIYVGLAIFMATRLILRGPRGCLWALTLVCAVAFGGELLDHLHESLRSIPCNSGDHMRDMWNTSFWPLILTVLEKHLGWNRIRPRGSGAGATTELKPER